MAVSVNASIHNVSPDEIGFDENGGTRWINIGSAAAVFLDRDNGLEVAIALIVAAEAALSSYGASRGTVRDHLEAVGSKLALRAQYDAEVAAGTIRTLEVPA